jgi:hypothetical protein
MGMDRKGEMPVGQSSNAKGHGKNPVPLRIFGLRRIPRLRNADFP